MHEQTISSPLSLQFNKSITEKIDEKIDYPEYDLQPSFRHGENIERVTRENIAKLK